MVHDTSKRRGHGEDSICWDASRNLYIGAVDLGLSPAGTRLRKKVGGKTKVEVRDKLRELHKQDVGLRPRRRYTVGDALEDWLTHGVDGLSERTVTLYQGTIDVCLFYARSSWMGRQGLPVACRAWAKASASMRRCRACRSAAGEVVTVRTTSGSRPSPMMRPFAESTP